MNVKLSKPPPRDYRLRWRFLVGGLFATRLALVTAANGLGATHYVDLNSGNPTTPYADWATAATNIQDALDASAAGDEVIVTNGTYAVGGRPAVTNLLSNRVLVDKPLTLRSVNGPVFTVILGYQVPTNILGDTAVRCVYLTAGGVLSGFTLTNGATRDLYSTPGTSDSMGAGVWCESASAVVSNCTLTGNCAMVGGGGAVGGTLNNCTLSDNSALGDEAEGGGANGSTLNNCVLSGNSAGADFGRSAYSGYGGGAARCRVNNCALVGNSAVGYVDPQGLLEGGIGGGAFASTLTRCTLTTNWAGGAGGGVAASSLSDCTLSGNSAGSWNGYGGYDGYGGGAAGGTLNNCMLIQNWAPIGGGGVSLLLR